MEDQIHEIEAIIKEESTFIGNDRYAIRKIWYDTFLKKDSSISPPQAPTSDKDPVIWVPQKAIELLFKWYGGGGEGILTNWKKGVLIFVDDVGREEIETIPTFSLVEIRTDETSKLPLSTLENVSAAEEIPSLVRKALDSIPSLRAIDEEDVRLWIRRSGDTTFQLCSSDEAKEDGASSSEDLPEEFDESTMNLKFVPSLRSVLGPSTPASVIHLLLETRNAEDGKFPRTTPRILIASTPRNGKETSASFDDDKRRMASKSFSQTSVPLIGQNLDAQRLSDNRWLEAKITKLDANGVTVHYLSFPSKMDEVFPLNSPRLQPPHSKVADWREQLKVGDEVDVHSSAMAARRGGRLYNNFKEKSGTTAWTCGSVKKIERKTAEPRVFIAVRFKFVSDSTFWVPLYSEKIAARYTHLARPKTETYGPQSSQGAPPVAGIVGLRNLGNTCYMNSMLQCLSHCQVLKDHFVTNAYQADINRKNPLGMGGLLAESFAQVITELWSGEFQVVAPVKFKQILGQMNMQFQGYQQHDSQELLTLLADGLHEDLNRIKKKPPTDPIESKGKTDEEVAKESWEAFQKRNDSKIVDELYGLMKSHLVCPTCKKEAIKFDAYSNVSVPVPSLSLVKVSFVFVNTKFEAIRCIASLPKRSGAIVLAEWIKNRFNVPDVDDLIIGEVVSNRVTTFFYRNMIPGSNEELPELGRKIKDIQSANLVIAWQLPTKKELPNKCATPLSQELDANWKGFFLEVEQIDSQAANLSQDQVCLRVKDLVTSKFTQQLYGPYPFAQKRLAKGLLQIVKSNDIASLVAREAVRIIEDSGSAAEPELIRECGTLDEPQLPNSAISSTDLTQSTSANGGNPEASPNKTKSIVSFRLLKRLVGKDLSKGESSAPGSPQTPQRTITPSSLAPIPVTRVEKDTRVSIEIQHVRNKVGGRIGRIPMFLSIAADRTWEDVKILVEQYLCTQVLAGFTPESENDQTPAIGAAKLELNSQTTSPVSAKLLGLFKIELESENRRVDLPIGPIPLVEQLVSRTLNSIIIVVKWFEPAHDFVFKSTLELQLEENVFRNRDADLGLGKVLLDSSCKEGEGGSEGATTTESISLQQCLDVFRKTEQLGEEDPWYCENCKDHRRAFKTMDIWNAPKILIIHLKRFLYERSGSLGERVQREKILDLVRFPITGFDFGPMLAGKKSGVSTTYDLFAVSNHMGGLGGGHYTAYVKSLEGSWWLMNDGVVSKVEDKNVETEIVSPNAYVLFYQRRD